MSVASLSPENKKHLEKMLLREKYNNLPPIGKTLALDSDPKGYANVLGIDWYALRGLDRLIAASIDGVSLYPLSPIETLVAYSNRPTLHDFELPDHFPEIRRDQWRDAYRIGHLHRSEQARALPDAQRLALYQWGAWTKRLGEGIDKDSGIDIKAWDVAPEFVRTNPLMQQIVALRTPVVLQECIRRNPRHHWDSTAIALSLLQTGISHQVPWYTLINNDAFSQLMSVNTGKQIVLGLTKPHLYQFPTDKLQTLLDTNPALFIHGLLHNRTLRESAIAKEWCVPMLEASFKRVLDNSVYAKSHLFYPQDFSEEQGLRFEALLQRFAPEYTRLLPVYQSLHAGDIAYTKWAKGCAKSLLEASNDAVVLPDLDGPVP